jgi:nucleotide-binding universal stress UspA family protein
MTFLVAYDGTSPAKRALEHTAKLAGRGGTVTVVNVIEAQGVGSRLESVSDNQRARQRSILREARALLLEEGVQMKSVPAVGDPTTEIRAAAEANGARVVVVGRGSGVRRLIHGSVSTRLVRQAPCDVLVVH